MSRAFVKEGDAIDDLPDRVVSERPNYVTANGLGLINQKVGELHTLYATAQVNADREAMATIARDLRYWESRKASAILIATPTETEEVRFGNTVAFSREKVIRTYRIVGEDEALPSQCTLSHSSPLAQSLLGRQVGDILQIGDSEIKIVKIKI